MNTQSNAVHDSALRSQVIAPAVIPATRQLYWLVRRELWESRSIYIAPLAVAAVFLFGFLLSLVRLPGKMRAAMALGPMQQFQVIEQSYNWAALLLMGTTLIVAVFYCLEALHSERRDRSILFWKSLPVSDLTTVLSKAGIPLVVLPLVTFTITLAMQWIMLLLSTAVLLGAGFSVAMLWAPSSWFQIWLLLLYHLVTVHVLWYAPIFGWLLLVSAWARRAPFVWAFIPLLAIGVVEKIAFNTTHFAILLESRLKGSESGPFLTRGMPMDPLTLLTPGKFLTSPGLWLGLVFTAICLAAAVRLRRSRGPI